jgi:DNA-directed RNA polymerase specialized sigma24 family protein
VAKTRIVEQLTEQADPVVANRNPVDQLLSEAQPRLQRALCAAFGPVLGDDAAAEALTWALAHSDRVLTFGNPIGYLFRVGQSWARREGSRRNDPPIAHAVHDRVPDVDLHRSLHALPDLQRLCVVLVHGYGYRYDEVAVLVGRSEASVRNHLHRGLARLRETVPPRLEPNEHPIDQMNAMTEKGKLL